MTKQKHTIYALETRNHKVFTYWKNLGFTICLFLSRKKYFPVETKVFSKCYVDSFIQKLKKQDISHSCKQKPLNTKGSQYHDIVIGLSSEEPRTNMFLMKSPVLQKSRDFIKLMMVMLERCSISYYIHW